MNLMNRSISMAFITVSASTTVLGKLQIFELNGANGGYREHVLAAALAFPSVYLISNLYGNVLSLKLKRRVLVILSSDLSPNIFKRGRWSVTTVNFGHPKTNMRHFSRASATAKASPSIGAYLLSASVVNREPKNVSFQPSLQQTGPLLTSHPQYF